MEGQRFDAIARVLSHSTTRRATLRALTLGLGAGIFSAHSRGSQAANECAQFCLTLSPGQRGQCISDCQQGTGLFYACGADPLRLCIAPDETAVCCPTGGSCASGTCECPEFYAYCPLTNTCDIDNCSFNFRLEFDPSTCQCRCEAPYIRLPGGGCGVGCATDADCGGASCVTSGDGLQICTQRNSYLPYCTPCETDRDCYGPIEEGGCQAINVFCDVETATCRGSL
jgi:hypothetical protein